MFLGDISFSKGCLPRTQEEAWFDNFFKWFAHFLSGTCKCLPKSVLSKMFLHSYNQTSCSWSLFCLTLSYHGDFSYVTMVTSIMHCLLMLSWWLYLIVQLLYMWTEVIFFRINIFVSQKIDFIYSLIVALSVMFSAQSPIIRIYWLFLYY